MKRNVLIAALAAVLPAALPAAAATAEGRYAVKEAGAAPCEVFIQERNKESPAHMQFIGWVSGYMTANNRFTENTFDIASWVQAGLMDAILADMCSKNLDKPFVHAVDYLISQLMPMKLTEPSEAVDVKVGDKQIRLYKEVLRRAQARLQEKGLYKGTPDGVFGDGTRKAFESFQKDAQIEVTGLPDQLTLFRLFAPETAKAQ